MAELIDQPLLYEVRLVGGPSDGLVRVIEASLADRPILTLPARPLDQSDGIEGLLEMGTSRSEYAMIDRCENRTLDRRTITVTYGFSAFESLGHRATAGRGAKPLRGLGRRLWSWMLAPVEYPLNCRKPS